MSDAQIFAKALEDEHGLAWRHNTKAAAELRRLDALVKAREQEIERLRAQLPLVDVEHVASSLFEHIKHGDEAHRVWLRAESLNWARLYFGREAQRVPLTDEVLADCVPQGAVIIEREGERSTVAMTRQQLHEFAERAIEAAHGTHPLQRPTDRPVAEVLTADRAATGHNKPPNGEPTNPEDWNAGYEAGIADERQRWVAHATRTAEAFQRPSDLSKEIGEGL